MSAKEIQNLKDEISELEAELLDMFQVAFHFAGLKKGCFNEAMDYYLSMLDNEDENAEYTIEQIISLINQIRTEKKEWFRS